MSKKLLREYYELCEGCVCQDLLTEDEKKFVDEFMEIMKTPGSRAVVYDADADDEANYDPTPTAIVDALRDNWLSSTLYLDELAKVMGIDTAMTGFTQKLYPPKKEYAIKYL